MLFRDRKDAGRQLAQKLLHLKSENPLVLALPRGGVPVALEVARALEAPLDLLLVRKLGVPSQPELAAGAVLDGVKPHVVLNESVIRAAGIPRSELSRIAKAELAEIERRRNEWLSGRERVPIAGHTAIVVDDGIATGATIRVALRAVRGEQAKRIVLAVPVASPEALADLQSECDEAVCVAAPPDFMAVGSYYSDFSQVQDRSVRDMLNQAQTKASA